MGLSVFPAASTGAKTYSFYVDAKAYATASSTVPAGVYSYSTVGSSTLMFNYNTSAGEFKELPGTATGVFKTTSTISAVNLISKTDGSTWTAVATPNFGTSNIHSIGFGNGIYVAGGSNGSVRTSTDTITWTSRTTGFTQEVLGFAYGNNIWVGVSNNSVYGTSTDGITWSSALNHGFGSMTGLVFANGLFLACGGGGVIIASTNGTTWTSRTTGTTNALKDITYGNNVYMAVGNTATILISTDSITWTSRTPGGSTHLQACAAGNGLFIAAGDSGSLRTSTDTITWDSRSTGFGSQQILCAAYANGIYIAGSGSSSTALAVSTNGVTWTNPTLPSISTSYVRDINYAKGKFVIVTEVNKMYTAGPGASVTGLVTLTDASATEAV